MTFLGSPLVTPRAVVRIAAAGFALVILLLAVACGLALFGTRTIEDDASQLVREHRLTARLIQEVQAEQNVLNTVLAEMLSGRQRTQLQRQRLARLLAGATSSIEKTISDAKGVPDRPIWLETGDVVHRFSADAQQALASPQPLTSDDYQRLFSLHGRVIEQVSQLVSNGAKRSAAIEGSIQEQSHQLGGEAFLLLGACFLLASICAVLTLRIVNELFHNMQWQANELSRVSWHLLESQEAAARRFSHELHDELGQSLTAIKANLSSMTPDALTGRRADCLGLVDEAIHNVRELSQLLRPVILDDFGLDAGLRWLSEGFMQRTRIDVHYQSEFPGRVQEEIETHLFRIAQEALTNIARHSGATEVRIALQQTGDFLRLQVEDNGKGIPVNSPPAGLGTKSSLGLVGMRARARQAGGELIIAKSKLGGVSIDVTVPLTEVLADESSDWEEDAHRVGR